MYQPIGAKVAYSSADSSTCRTKTDIINHWESTTRDLNLATNTSSVGYEHHSDKCVSGSTISSLTDLSLMQCTKCTENSECRAVSFLASPRDAETLAAIDEIISNNPFGVAFSSEDVTRFGTCELKSSSDHGDCTVSSDFSGNGLYVKLASSLLSEGMGVKPCTTGFALFRQAWRLTADYTCQLKAHVRWQRMTVPHATYRIPMIR